MLCMLCRCATALPPHALRQPPAPHPPPQPCRDSSVQRFQIDAVAAKQESCDTYLDRAVKTVFKTAMAAAVNALLPDPIAQRVEFRCAPPSAASAATARRQKVDPCGGELTGGLLGHSCSEQGPRHCTPCNA